MWGSGLLFLCHSPYGYSYCLCWLCWVLCWCFWAAEPALGLTDLTDYDIGKAPTLRPVPEPPPYVAGL